MTSQSNSQNNSQIVCSGGLILARNTGRYLLLLRNRGRTAGTWGLVGGRADITDGCLRDTLMREIGEELGASVLATGLIERVIPLELYTSRDLKFEYNTYCVIVSEEFIPQLNSEHCSYAWCQRGAYPRPLHQGVKNSLNNRIVQAKLDVIKELLA